MKIQLKCFASLSRYLPSHARFNAAEVEVPDGCSVNDAIDFFRISRDEAHLVIVNGVFVCPENRETTHLQPDDTLALWPEVAGG